MSNRSNLQGVIDFLNSNLALDNTHDTYALPQVYEGAIDGFEFLQTAMDELEAASLDIDSISNQLGNESTFRQQGDIDLLSILNELTDRFNKLVHGEAPAQDNLNGHRKYLHEFFELISTDQIDGYKQQMQFFSNALGSKIDGLDADLITGIQISYSNPARPRIIQNRPRWLDIQSKPSTFPPDIHSHSQSDVTGLPVALNNKENLSSKGIANGYADLDATGKVPASRLPIISALEIVNTIAQRNTLAPTVNLPVYVKNATGDPTVSVGGAYYLWEVATSSWIKTSEAESLDIVQSWANITNKPTSDGIPEGISNLYFLASRALGSLLTGFTITNVAVNATDSIIIAFGKLQGQINNIPNRVRATLLTGISFATGGNIISTDSVLVAFGKIQRYFDTIQATIANTLLTGFSTFTTPVTNADNVLTAFGKLQGQIDALVKTTPNEKALWNNTIIDQGLLGASKSFDLGLNRVHKGTLNANFTLTLSNPVEGNVYVIRFIQDATGGRTITLPVTVRIPSGESPDSTASMRSLLTLYWDGTEYLGSWKKGWI